MASPRLVTELEAYLTQHVEMGRFLTLFAGLLDPGTGHLRFVNAGQNPPLLISREGRTQLPTTGPPVAIFPTTIPRAIEECVLLPGSLLLIASDGVTEYSQEGVQYDEGRFQGFLDRTGPGGAEAVGRALIVDVNEFGAGAPPARRRHDPPAHQAELTP